MVVYPKNCHFGRSPDFRKNDMRFSCAVFANQDENNSNLNVTSSNDVETFYNIGLSF